MYASAEMAAPTYAMDDAYRITLKYLTYEAALAAALLASPYLRSNGYTVTTVTPSSAKQDIDQIKKHAEFITPPDAVWQDTTELQCGWLGSALIHRWHRADKDETFYTLVSRE
jgi:hypothetical protein